MAGISSKAAGSLTNRYKFNGGNELQSGEFNDGSGLETYDAIHRMYDPQIGRFHQLDPFADVLEDQSLYSFVHNNPILRNDPSGLKDTVYIAPKPLPSVTVTSTRHVTESESNNNHSFYFFSTMLSSADTYYDIFNKNYDHKNYLTTQGKIKPFPIDIKRMSKQAQSAKFRSYSVKKVGFGISLLANVLTAIQVRDQYEHGNVDPIDAAGLTLGTTGLFSNGLSAFGFAPKTLGAISEFTGVGGMVLGTYQTWMTTFQTIYNTNLPNSNPYNGNTDTQFQAALDDQVSEGRWY